MNDKKSKKTEICKKCPVCMTEETTRNIKFLHAKKPNFISLIQYFIIL
jgi:hypothetical protein